MELARLDWQTAAHELADEHRRSGTPAAVRARATVASLRGRFTDDYALATRSSEEALRLEPLDPMHHVRDALVRLRFGDVDGAIARLDALPEGVNDLPIILVVKALATARRGEARTARNIADRALQVDAAHDGARFLYTEANLAAAAKGGLDKLAELPKGARFDAAWADLLARLAILRPGDLRAVNDHLARGAITKGSRPLAIARSIAEWVAITTPPELAAIVEAQEPDSRGEHLAVGLLVGRLDKGKAIDACRALRELRDRLPDRPALRRALAAQLTRLAIEEAGEHRYASALSAVQQCIALEPHEAVHYQNRAALFTLLGEHDAALDAWAELDRQHYRLALVGRLDAKSLARYAAPHRMFALSARLTKGRQDGVFLVEDGQLAANQEAIDRDPDQLRQWLHHARAALVFDACALRWDPVRGESFAQLATSLEVLVPEEGKQLAAKLAARFRATRGPQPARYGAIAVDPATLLVLRTAIELYAEVALLCVQWAPDPKRRALFEEVADTVRALAGLLDEALLDAMLKERHDDTPPHALFLLKRVLRTADSAKRLEGFLLAYLRTSLVQRRWDDAEGNVHGSDLEGLIEQLELARADNDTIPRVEFWIARFSLAGDFLDDCAAAIKRYHALAKDGDSPLASAIAKLQEALDERASQPARGKRRDGTASTWTPPDAGDFAAREAALEAQPTSLQLYTDLCHDLGLAKRWSDAHAWAARAIARCLSPAGQLRARELALELGGLESLAAADGPAVASYIAGARASAAAALDKLATGDAGLEYVRGLAYLAADRRADAQRAFKHALATCTRGIFMAVLRPLAADIEVALLEAAKKEIDAACVEGRFADAFARIAERMATVKAPEPYVLELARTQLAAILPTIGTAKQPVAPTPIRTEAAWRGELARALGTGDPRARTRELIALATIVHPASARECETLTRRLDELEAQLAMAAALDRAAKLATSGKLAEALEALALLESNARVLRQRAIVLLKLDRLDDADAAVAALRELPDAIAREFALRYQSLRVRHQIGKASTAIRDRDFALARAILLPVTAHAPPDRLELAYCHACVAAAEGYRAKEQGDRTGSARLLLEAARHLAPLLDEARAARHERFLELHTRLEAEHE